jgi:hypothetical protein
LNNNIKIKKTTMETKGNKQEAVLKPKKGKATATKKRTVIFIGNGKSLHLGKGEHAVTAEEAKMFTEKGYGKVK